MSELYESIFADEAADHARQSQEHHRVLLNTRLGRGSCSAHHGEIMQGMFHDGEHIRRGLVTLPCPLFQSTAKFLVSVDKDIFVFPESRKKRKAAYAARLTLNEIGFEDTGGSLFIGSDIPEGWGLGSSTSDVVATIRAVADAFNRALPAGTIARLAVKAEIASDSIMFEDEAVLFAQRDGIVIETFKNPLPNLSIVGFDTDPFHAGVDTLLYPPAEYTWPEIEAFRPLLGRLRGAFQERNVADIGHIATESAKINQRFLPKPRFDTLLRIAKFSRALGVQVAHSGSVVGLIFDATDADAGIKIADAIQALNAVGFRGCHRFSTAGGGDSMITSHPGS